MGQTETLQDEVSLWENKKKALQEEKTQLAFILEAHKSVCSRVSSESALNLDVKPFTSEPRVLVKAEPAPSEHSETSHPCRGNGGQQSTGDGDNDSPTRSKPKTKTSVQPSRWQRFKQPEQPQHSHRDTDQRDE